MIEKLKSEMIKYYSGDPKRIQHFIKVYFFCDMIGKTESLSEEEKKALKEYLNNNELDDETLDKVSGGGLTFSSGIAQML